MKFKIVIGCIILFAFQPLLGQEKKAPQQLVEELVESLAETSDSELDFTSLIEELIFLTEHPLNLNSAQLEDFERLPFLTQFQRMSLLAYRERNGDILSIYELSLISGFDETAINTLLPFVTIQSVKSDAKFEFGNALKFGKNELITRVSGLLEGADGYTKVPDSLRAAKPNDYYPGNRLRYYAKYKFSFKEQMEFGITAEKDPGEQFFKGSQSNGFDFYSAHLQLNDLGAINTLVLGDYETLYGQGLVMGSYLSNSKSAMVMDIRKKFKGLKKYSSTDENQFFRGIGASFKLKNFTFSAFGSHKPLDANLETDSTQRGNLVITSFQNTGIHATPSQLTDKHSINETVFGGSLQWKFQEFQVGLNGITTTYSLQVSKSNLPDDLFHFTGTQNQNLSTDFFWTYRSIYLFGEAALSSNKGKAVLIGSLLQLTPQVSISMLYRDYGKDYQTLHGNAFSESGKNQNEQGFYSGIQLIPFKKWKLSAYYDFYRFPMITSKADGPSKGFDYFIQADFSANRNLTMYGKIKREVHEVNVETQTSDIAPLTEQQQWQFRYHISYTLSNQWQFKNRIELTQFNQLGENTEQGFLMYQDINYDSEKLPFSLALRYAIYQTDTYNTRIYAYESDVLHAFSVPALYDKGTRVYLLINYRFSEHGECWVKLSQTAFANKTEIGSGMDRISGNTKTELKFQVKWKF